MKKNFFVDKNKLNRSNNKTNRTLNLFIEKKLNSSNLKIQKHMKNKALTNKSNSKVKKTDSNYDFNHTFLKNNNNKSKYNNSYLENQKLYKAHIEINKAQNLLNIIQLYLKSNKKDKDCHKKYNKTRKDYINSSL